MIFKAISCRVYVKIQEGIPNRSSQPNFGQNPLRDPSFINFRPNHSCENYVVKIVWLTIRVVICKQVHS